MNQSSIKVAHLLAQAANESDKEGFEYDEDVVFSLNTLLNNMNNSRTCETEDSMRVSYAIERIISSFDAR